MQGGWLHTPAVAWWTGMAQFGAWCGLSRGGGSNCESGILPALATAHFPGGGGCGCGGGCGNSPTLVRLGTILLQVAVQLIVLCHPIEQIHHCINANLAESLGAHRPGLHSLIP